MSEEMSTAGRLLLSLEEAKGGCGFYEEWKGHN